MKIYKFISVFIFIFFYCSINLFSQPEFQLIKKIPINGNYMTSDAIGNIYIIEGSTLLKYNSMGELQYTYSNLSEGNLTNVDVSDPLKILVFNREFNKIRFLDQTLTVRGNEIQLDELGNTDITLVCSSFEGGFWTYNPGSFSLIKFNSNLDIEQTGVNISQITDIEINPSFLTEYHNDLYMCDTAYGIMLFDRYGTYIRTYPFKKVRSLQIENNDIIMFDGEKISVYNTRSQLIQNLDPVADKQLFVRFYSKYMYVLTDSELLIFLTI